MKNLFSIFAVLLALAITLHAEPKIEVEGGDTYDWGTVWQADSPLKADVKIFNKGADTLVITEVKPGCGCTVAPIDKDHIAPGDFATMKIELKVNTSTGPIMKGINITSNDPNTVRKYYYLKANVKAAIESTPPFVSFNKIEMGKDAFAKVKITNNLNKPVTFKDYVIYPQDMQVQLPKDYVLAGGKSVEMILSYKPVYAGFVNGNIVIKTDSPEVDKININIAADVFNPAVPDPKSMKLETHGKKEVVPVAPEFDNQKK